MPEGLSPSEVGKEIGAHGKHPSGASEGDRRTRTLSVIEALLLSLVAVLAAFSGYAAAKWGTDSSVSLAKASALRTKANRADLEGLQSRTLDSVSFNAWFAAYVAPATRTRSVSPRRGFGRVTGQPSTPGWPPIRHTTRRRRRGPPTCRST